VTICHAPNHRGFKGSEFVIDAVKKLQDEGLKVELRLVEKMQNNDVRRYFNEQADILVEQLIFTGHGLNGLEGLASGLPVISNLEDETYILPMRRWSYFSECPIVSATPENLIDVLRKLITRPELRKKLGCAGRQYAEKYHGMDSAVYLFEAVIDLAYGRRDSLINLYHPLLGDYPRRKPRVEHPLVNNRIID
jgi:glycosyltransferase involved in cell wall biosynthesis